MKPSSVQVTAGGEQHGGCQDVDNWESCCTVPEELRYFAKNNGVTLLANWDPVDMLPGGWSPVDMLPGGWSPVDMLPGGWIGDMGYPGRDREGGQYSKTWVARWGEGGEGGKGGEGGEGGEV